MRFRGLSRNWIFIRPSQLQITKGKNYKITLMEALAKGFDLKTLIGEGEQMRLGLES